MVKEDLRSIPLPLSEIAWLILIGSLYQINGTECKNAQQVKYFRDCAKIKQCRPFNIHAMNKIPEKNEPSMPSPANPNYLCPESFQLTSLAKLAKEKQDEIISYKPLKADIWNTIQNKIMVDWTHHSNAIEGSTLTRGETGFFLQYGLTVKGKPLKDFLDVRNHADAIEFLFELIKEERDITPFVLKEFNALLLSGVNYTEAVDAFGQKVRKKAHPGEFKKEPNHVQQIDGSIHYYVEPAQVPNQIETLCSWINENEGKQHPAIVAAIAHYNMVRIHPFDDGNGRGARLLMNLLVMKKGYFPVVIKSENRQDYIEGLMAADRGNLEPFTHFILSSLIETQDLMLSELRKTGKP